MPSSLHDFIRRPAPRWLRLASLTLIYSATGLALLLLASLLPLAAWHRLFFQLRGWWLMPAVYLFSALSTLAILAATGYSQPWMLLVPSGALALLWIRESHLILQAAPRLARERIAIDTHEVVRA